MRFGSDFYVTALLLSQVVAARDLTIRRTSVRMHACVWFDKAPSTPIRIDFATGSHFDRCMYESGDSVSLKISRSGLSCTAIGHVTQEYDDGCNRAGGIWTLAYRGGGYAGDTASYWHTSPASDRTARCTLQKSTPWTDVCRSEEVCGNRDVRWSVYDEPDLWVVFKPEMDGKEELFKADIAGKDSNGDEKSLLVEAQRSPTPACAKFHACVYLHKTPSRVEGFHFYSHNNNCMRKIGTEALIITRSAGLTCEPLGVVEEDYEEGKDCTTHAHVWRLSCQGDGYHATLNSEWNYARWHTGELLVHAVPKPGVHLCPEK